MSIASCQETFWRFKNDTGLNILFKEKEISQVSTMFKLCQSSDTPETQIIGRQPARHAVYVVRIRSALAAHNPCWNEVVERWVVFLTRSVETFRKIGHKGQWGIAYFSLKKEGTRRSCHFSVNALIFATFKFAPSNTRSGVMMETKHERGILFVWCKTVHGTMAFIFLVWDKSLRKLNINPKKRNVSPMRMQLTHTTGGSQLLPTEEVWKGLEAVGESQHLSGWLGMTPKNKYDAKIRHVLTTTDTWAFPARVVTAENIWFVFIFPRFKLN